MDSWNSNKISVPKMLLYGFTGFCSGKILIKIGFLLYYLNKRKEITDTEKQLKESQTVPDEILEKIVEKIKSHIVYNMAVVYDKHHEYDQNNFKDENESTSDGSTTHAADEKEGRITKFQSIKKNFSEIKKNPKKVVEDLINIELQVIKSFNIPEEEYFASLFSALHTNKKLQSEIKFLTEFKSHFENDELMPINFGRPIREKFLKIVSNIYWLNLRDVSRALKKNYFDMGHKFANDGECNKVVFSLYEKYLKTTR